MAEHILYLHPADHEWRRPVSEITGWLREIGFVADPIGNTDASYQIGDHFLQQINFLGCSPNIEISDKGDGTDFCHIVIGSGEPRLIHSRRFLKSPRCPSCRATVTDWSTIDIEAVWTCPQCDTTSMPKDLDWRRTAGIASTFVAVTQVFPNEAVPQPAFLGNLETHTGTTWRYFYYAD